MKWLRRITFSFSVFFVALALVAFILPVEQNNRIASEDLANDDGQFITINDIQLYMKDEGAGDAGTLIMLHGLFGSTESWRYNTEALVDAGFRVVRFDRPAFGLSDKRAELDYSISSQMDLTAGLMDALAIDEAVILGHSAGGNLATNFGLRYPERVTDLVLVDAASLGGGPPAFVGGIVALPSVWRWARFLLQQFFTREQLERTLRGFYVDDSFWTEADTDAYWRTFETDGWDVGLLALTRDGGGSNASEAQIRTIEVPTLIIWGSEDTVTPLSQGERLTQLIPDSTLIIIDDVGHQPFEEKPDQFNDILIEYFEGR